jgi:sterol desaturase/sphingolipid hydroxylase (fatty acid hydroxylase superfamily)
MSTVHVGFALLGAVTWSFLEYVIHRWLGHDKRFRKNLFAKEHIRHHAVGDYFAPNWKKLIAALTVGTLVGTPAVWLFGSVGLAYTIGLLGFYSVYEILHRLMHVTPGVGPYARWARQHHFAHHFVDPRLNHGVTSPLWDLVFGTYHRAGQIVVPEKLCMSWLKDQATGKVRADWAQTFVVR